MSYQMNLRRYRQSKAIRDIMSTVELYPKQLIQPYFIYQGLDKACEMPSIFGQKKHTKESILAEIETGLKNGVKSVLLFFIPSQKSVDNFNYDFELDVIAKIKNHFGNNLVVATDMCLCSQTQSGHCGIISEHGEIDNCKSVEVLAQKALFHAQAGSDIISPSDMMDDRIAAIRKTLNSNHYDHTMIMSYSTKFSSNLYGPFRAAAESTPEFGDRKSYQIDYRNGHDAIRSSLRDKKQGADILMVKPAGMYLDIIKELRMHPQLMHMPLAAYQVSGEYQGLYVMSQAGMIDFNLGLFESLIAIKRAGADLIITYAANQFKNIQQQLQG